MKPLGKEFLSNIIIMNKGESFRKIINFCQLVKNSHSSELSSVLLKFGFPAHQLQPNIDLIIGVIVPVFLDFTDHKDSTRSRVGGGGEFFNEELSSGIKYSKNLLLGFTFHHLVWKLLRSTFYECK